MTPSGKRYEVETFEQLMNIATEENFENLSIDFIQWMAFYLDHVKRIRELYPKECEGKSNWEITSGKFIWIDDGKNDVKKVVVKNKHTGEVVEKSFE